MKTVRLFACFTVTAVGITWGCSSASRSPTLPDDHGMASESGKDHFPNQDEILIESSSDATDTQPPDRLEEEALDERDNLNLSDDSEQPGIVHQWSPVFERCETGFTACAALGWYVRSPAYIRLTAEGDFKGEDCTATIEADGVEKEACPKLPCDVKLEFDEDTYRTTLRGVVTCWGEEKTTEQSLTVFVVVSEEMAPCIGWGEWKATTIDVNEGGFYGAPRILESSDLCHLFVVKYPYDQDSRNFVHYFQDTPEHWVHEYIPDGDVQAVPPMGVAEKMDGSIHLLSVERYIFDDGYDGIFVTYRLHKDGVWLPRQVVMPAGYFSGDGTFSLVAEEDGRLDGLMYILKPSVWFCGQPEWSWICELLPEDNLAMVLLRIRELNDGSWSVTRVFSEDNGVGIWMSYVATRHLFHYDVKGSGSAAFLASDHYAGFLTLEPEAIYETRVCDGIGQCSYWAAAAASPKRDGLVAVIEQNSVFKKLRFIPGQEVIEEDLPWSAEVVVDHGFSWPYLLPLTTTGGYQQMMLDSLGRIHLVMSFIMKKGEEFGPPVNLYLRQYPNSDGQDWTIEPIDEPGVAFLMMDSKATVHVFIVNTDEKAGPEGIKLLTRRCENYLVSGE